MYIAPNSTIELFKNLKLDNSYANTMWFTNASAQNTFFVNHRFTQLNDYSYQRKDIGVIRVEGTVSSLYDVNYMRFKNTSFENKWFYAFVTRVEYVNNATVNMYYAIDVIQTYMFDWQLQQCLVERQHSTTDVAGDNLIPEGLELGDYINDLNSILWSPDTSRGYSYLVALGCTSQYYTSLANASTPQLISRGVYGGLVNGLYSAVAYLICDTLVDPDIIKNLINQLQTDNMIDAVISITMIPSELSLTEAVFSDDYVVTKPTSLDGYTPKNKKLLTYPYCMLDIYNDQTEHQELRYELFSNSSCTFTLNTVLSATPEAIIYARDYNNSNKNPDNALSISGFPQIPYYNDSYKAWCALNYDQMAASREIAAQQNAFNQTAVDISSRQLNTNTLFNSGRGVVNTIGNLMSGNIMKAISSGADTAQSFLNSVYEARKIGLESDRSEYEEYSVLLRQSADESRAKKLANTPHAGSSSMAVATETKGFWYNKISIRKQYAERIDKYFTMFGYAQNIVAIPNIHARQYFTYVKTTGSCVSGSIPQDDRETIDTIFDRGIRFWTNYDYFENYTVNNAII